MSLEVGALFSIRPWRAARPATVRAPRPPWTLLTPNSRTARGEAESSIPRLDSSIVCRFGIVSLWVCINSQRSRENLFRNASRSAPTPPRLRPASQALLDLLTACAACVTANVSARKTARLAAAASAELGVPFDGCRDVGFSSRVSEWVETGVWALDGELRRPLSVSCELFRSLSRSFSNRTGTRRYEQRAKLESERWGRRPYSARSAGGLSASNDLGVDFFYQNSVPCVREWVRRGARGSQSVYVAYALCGRPRVVTSVRLGALDRPRGFKIKLETV